MKRSVFYLTVSLLLACLSAALANAGAVEAPLDVRRAVEATFVKSPAASKEGEHTMISFEASAATDVEVAIVDAAGKVVRHLAAGLLGANAPAPLQKDALAQSLMWDGKDDAGQAAAGGPFAVRVRLGSEAKLEKYLGRRDLTFVGTIEAITVGAGGELYVLTGEGFKFGRAELLVLDKDGKYLRTIMPYPASTPPDRTESVGHLMIGGQRVPILFSGHAFCVYPLVCGIRGQTMAWHPGGYLIAASSTGTAREHGPPRHLLAFAPTGGAPAGVPFVGPQILAPRGFLGGGGERNALGMDRLAVSPDGQFVYLVQHFDSPRFEKAFWKHGVYRVRWADKRLGGLWVGKDAPGAADGEFNEPTGIAVDKQGRVYVCDRGNGRVQVFDAEGKLLGKFAVDNPEQIAVRPDSGEIFILARKAAKGPGGGKLLAFGPWDRAAAARRGELDVTGLRLMALDPTSSPVRLWTVVGKTNQTLVPVTYRGGQFEAGEPIADAGGLRNPSFLAADPDRDRVIVKEHLVLRSKQPFQAISLTSGEKTSLAISGSDLALDAAGNIYCTDGYAETFLARYTPAGEPLAFAGTESNRIPVKFRNYGPDEGLRGHRVGPNGDIYIVRSVEHGVGATLDQYGPDGKIKKAGLVAGIGSGDCGIGVDAAGNVYLGLNLKPVGNPYPPEFDGKVPPTDWAWWRKKQMPPPWGYIYINPYLFHMGGVMKFGPAGGTIYGAQSTRKGEILSAGSELANAPADATPYKSACLDFDVKVAGAQWRYGGVGLIPASIDGVTPDPGCKCMPSHLDADLYGRVFAPDPFLFSVEMIDAAGNRISRIGSYGNADDPGPRIAFAGPEACDFAEADGKLYVSDIANRRVAVVGFQWSAQAQCTIP